ncbi:MAG TPA: LLM class flavin-dependent oxidoreductase [Thermoplasmata archaeon]|nr:LLM class flavin-dependent oxidoreductase [Thermoplasmata archaeon]
MKLSAFTIVDSHPIGSGEGRDRYREVLELAEGAEQGGLAAIWVAEHHFQPGGLCPSPPVLLSAIAARTRRVRVGALVSVLPFHNPIEVAEQYAMVDQLSGGRLNFGAGSGYIPVELDGFGVDPATKRERFDRALDTILAAWRGDAVRGDGSTAAEVRLNVRPVQQPHPPIHIAVQRREAVPFVARRGANLALVPYATVHDLDELAAEVQEFRQHLPEGSHGEVAAALHLYAGDRPERARAALQRYLDSRLATQSRFYQAKVDHDPHQASAATIEAGGWALFGRPGDVADRLEAFRRVGIDEVLGIFDFGGLSAAEVSSSVRALGPLLR